MPADGGGRIKAIDKASPCGLVSHGKADPKGRAVLGKANKVLM